MSAVRADTSRARILVIEDDEDTRANLRDILELDDYEVQTAGTAAEALALERWDGIAVVILDRQLPDGSAQSLMPHLRRLVPRAAVIIVTGHSDLEGAIDALRLGAADYILKPLNAEAMRMRVAGVVERYRLAEAKERSDAAFRNLVDVAEVMIVMLRPDDTVLYFSPFAEELTGYRAAEVLGQNYLDLFALPEERETVAANHRLVLKGGRVRGIERRVLRKDGSTRWVLKSARCLCGFEGTDVLLIVQQDITGMRRAQDRALQSERLAAIGQMVAGLAHESRNALQRSQACLDMLRLKVNDRDDAIGLIDRIQKAQDDLQHLFEDVRIYSAPIQLERRECDLPKVWREAWLNATSTLKDREAVLVEQLPSDPLTCDADPFRLGQVFRNIFDNSVAACHGNVRVVLTAAPLTKDPDSPLRVSARDNGPGLDGEQRLHIFDAFYTTKTKGTGLGMAIVKRILDAHGGAVEVGQAIGGSGTEIVLTIPRRAPDEPRVAHRRRR